MRGAGGERGTVIQGCGGGQAGGVLGAQREGQAHGEQRGLASSGTKPAGSSSWKYMQELVAQVEVQLRFAGKGVDSVGQPEDSE